MQVARWARGVVATALGADAPLTRDAELVQSARAIERQLHAIGNNLNQAVRLMHGVVNAGGRMPAGLLDDLLDAIEDFAEPLAEVRAWSRRVTRQ